MDPITIAAAGTAIGGLFDIGMGIAGAAGQSKTNKWNRDMMREQMAFQERMSNTSAQRSVEDYRKAGLNPALAYERGASSPGGASTQLGDVVGAGLNSARASAQMRQQLQSMIADRYKTMKEAEVATQNAESIKQTRQFAAELQPYLRQQAAQATILQALGIPGAENQADLERRLRTIVPGGTSSAKTMADLFLRLFRR